MELGDRMKAREQGCDTLRVEPWQYCVLRFDGRSFSKLTSGLRKPFDKYFYDAMKATLIDVVEESSAQTGYCHSDEISLIFRPIYKTKEEYDDDNNKSTHMFGGRISKLISVFASYISVRFNHHISTNLPETYSEQLKNKLSNAKHHFDGRAALFDADEGHEVLNYIIWRQRDCYRNCISTYAATYIGKKEIHKKNTDDMTSMLKERRLSVSKDIPDYYKHGIIAKRVKVFINDTERRRIDVRTIKIKADNDHLYIIDDKLWDQKY